MLAKWIYGIIAVSAICALCNVLTPDGRVKKAAEIVFGIVILFAVISPLSVISFNDYSISSEKYKLEADKIISDGEAARKNLDRRIIEEKYETYILDKAKNEGVKPDSVRVTCAWCSEGYWYPESAEIYLDTDCGDEEYSPIIKAIEAELGIEASRQNWRTK